LSLLDRELEQLNQKFEMAHPEEILTWAVERFWPNIAASSSFQTQGMPLLHMISRAVPQLPVIFLDTGYHFPETLIFRDQLTGDWQLNLKVIRAAQPEGEGEFSGRHNRDLYRRDPDRCCYINKVEPMQRVLAGLEGWISGIRRDQSPARAGIKILERLDNGALRIHPMATWRRQDIFQYIHDRQLPEHPLLAQGYLTVGCAPCTRPVFDGTGERSGRWNGHDKTECGLHTVLRQPAPAEPDIPKTEEKASTA